MFMTMAKLKALVAQLHDAGKEDGARGGFWCQAPRRDANGDTGWKNGETFVEYGPHGVGYLQIDPATGAISCAACAGTVDATATPKTEVTIKGRKHFVSGLTT